MGRFQLRAVEPAQAIANRAMELVRIVGADESVVSRRQIREASLSRVSLSSRPSTDMVKLPALVKMGAFPGNSSNSWVNSPRFDASAVSCHGVSPYT